MLENATKFLSLTAINKAAGFPGRTEVIIETQKMLNSGVLRAERASHPIYGEYDVYCLTSKYDVIKGRQLHKRAAQAMDPEVVKFLDDKFNFKSLVNDGSEPVLEDLRKMAKTIYEAVKQRKEGDVSWPTN